MPKSDVPYTKRPGALQRKCCSIYTLFSNICVKIKVRGYWKHNSQTVRSTSEFLGTFLQNWCLWTQSEKGITSPSEGTHAGLGLKLNCSLSCLTHQADKVLLELHYILKLVSACLPLGSGSGSNARGKFTVIYRFSSRVPHVSLSVQSRVEWDLLPAPCIPQTSVSDVSFHTHFEKTKQII